MGNDISKEIKDIAETLEVNDLRCMTPTSNVSRVDIDPRSPTEGILRTPIEVRESSEAYSLRRRCISEPELSSEKSDDTCMGHVHILRNDPRSPSLGITRTPIQIQYNTKICKKISSDESLNSSLMEDASMVVNVSDSHFPSLGICQTPIQVTTSGENVTLQESPIMEPAAISKDSKLIMTTPVASWQTPVSKVPSSPSFVYADEGSVEIRGKRDKQYEQNTSDEKENNFNLKRKLMFTPETIKTGVKVRTPLGSRCNFQDSPSQLLKIMQVQKVDQELCVNECVSSSVSLATKVIKKTHPVVEWDNKDSTIVM